MTHYLSISGDSVEEVMGNMNKNVQLLSKGVNYNQLKLNVEKTNFMVITNKRIVKNEVSLNINDQPIERVTKMKYLGMMLNDALMLDDHVCRLYMQENGEKVWFNAGSHNTCVLMCSAKKSK
jgi:hypothetical protein